MNKFNHRVYYLLKTFDMWSLPPDHFPSPCITDILIPVQRTRLYLKKFI